MAPGRGGDRGTLRRRTVRGHARKPASRRRHELTHRNGDPTPPTGEPATGDVITAVRADSVVARTVSSLDNAQRATGQVELVLALRALADDTKGHFGPVAGNVPPAPKAGTPGQLPTTPAPAK